MFGEAKEVRVRDITMTIENGVFSIETTRGTFKVHVDVNLKFITNGRIKGVLNTEKFAYGLVKPVLTRVEQTNLKKNLSIIENVLTDKIIHFIVMNQSFTGQELSRTLYLGYGHIAIVENRQVSLTA